VSGGFETPLGLARKAAAVLREQGHEHAQLDAELLLGHVLGIKRLDLYLQFERPLTEAEVEAYRAVIRRRRRGEPVQYITGEAAFRELVLAVDRRVLIPRPETEVLVGEVLRWAWARVGVQPPRAGRGRADAEAVRELAALDVGTGSGAIALSLAQEGPFRRVVATDSSAEALEVAAENARRTGHSGRVELRAGSLFEPVAGERFDVIASNPPYVGLAERALVAADVIAWEPSMALFAGEDGLEIIDAIVAAAPEHLAPGGLLALEVGHAHGAEVIRRIDATGAYASARVVRDLAGRERLVLAEAPALVQPPRNGEHVTPW